MTSFLKNSTLLVTALGLAACATPSQTQKVMEEHPEILYNVIEKNPEKFMEVVQKAAQKAQEKSVADRQKGEQERVQAEIDHPLTPTIDETRVWGDKSAPITIVEYSDFQCPYCQRGYNTTEEVLKKYGNKVKFVFKNLPLSFHPYAMPAAKRFTAISLQSEDKAHRFYHEVFKNQDKLEKGGENFLDLSAKKAGANMAKMKTDMNSEKVKAMIDADMDEAKKYGFQGTPGFIISGVSLRGAYPAASFEQIIDKKLAKGEQEKK
jgi:protein-disulfide isomerase